MASGGILHLTIIEQVFTEQIHLIKLRTKSKVLTLPCFWFEQSWFSIFWTWNYKTVWLRERSVWLRVWSALSQRAVCQTVDLFSSVSLTPLGPITGEHFVSYLCLAKNGVCVCVCVRSSGALFRTRWMDTVLAARRQLKESLLKYKEKKHRKWTSSKTKASVTDWRKKIVCSVRASGSESVIMLTCNC